MDSAEHREVAQGRGDLGEGDLAGLDRPDHPDLDAVAGGEHLGGAARGASGHDGSGADGGVGGPGLGQRRLEATGDAGQVLAAGASGRVAGRVQQARGPRHGQATSARVASGA